MLQAIKVKGHVGSDGILKLEVPVQVINQDIEAMVVVQVQTRAAAIAATDANGWPVGFFERTYGALADDPIERGDQGTFEIREPIE